MSRQNSVRPNLQPETVVRWHQAGFKLYWKWISRRKARCRLRISRRISHPSQHRPFGDVVVKYLEFAMNAWRSPARILRNHAEDEMAQFLVSWHSARAAFGAFLSNHREAIAAMDFFTVPTLTFGVLYCFFVIAHDRRRIGHFNETKHPTSAWAAEQLREAILSTLHRST